MSLPAIGSLVQIRSNLTDAEINSVNTLRAFFKRAYPEAAEICESTQMPAVKHIKTAVEDIRTKLTAIERDVAALK